MALARFVSIGLRTAELVFACIVAGVTGDYLHKSNASSMSLWRFIYTVTVAALSILLALLWLIPFSSTFVHWPVDIFISILWWISFGVLVNFIGDNCGAVFNWSNVHPRGDQCGKFKADIAFAFLSALLWLVSALVGLLWLKKREKRVVKEHHGHRRWHRSHV
ncbi:hypothetical protein Golomagni_06868 [Golovinomyces magnicellulatus]|nr:hypothetical protein Golomagni_06868 [Golovinomyces magnicellulatus]